MNEHTSTGRSRKRRAGAAALAAGIAAGIALAAAGCGGGTAPAPPGRITYQDALAYAQCMRSHGEPGFPDPDSQGIFASLGPVDIHSPAYLSAARTCGHLLPSSTVTAAQRQQDFSRALKYAACMRSHGILDYRDPTELPNGNIELGGPPGPGSSPQMQAAGQACRRFQPPGLP